MVRCSDIWFNMEALVTDIGFYMHKYDQFNGFTVNFISVKDAVDSKQINRTSTLIISTFYVKGRYNCNKESRRTMSLNYYSIKTLNFILLQR